MRLGVERWLEAPNTVSKDVTLALPWGDLKLTNVQLQVELGADGSVERLRGTADMPFPTFGPFDESWVVTPARADLGLELGSNLAGLNLGLEPDRQYLFLNVDTAFGMAARAPGKSAEFAFSLAPGQHLTLVIDTVEPIAYLDGQLTLSLDGPVCALGRHPRGPRSARTRPIRCRYAVPPNSMCPASSARTSPKVTSS